MNNSKKEKTQVKKRPTNNPHNILELMLKKFILTDYGTPIVLKSGFKFSDKIAFYAKVASEALGFHFEKRGKKNSLFRVSSPPP